mmetsp:Transcript_26314/g.43683  ORF Transcript_26314/g.43683 Transcript_26314/m.43683 type:complete len:227 (-) Transcript_26314:20-700(-)
MLASSVGDQFGNEVLQWRQLLRFDEVKFAHEKHKVAKASVEMGLCAHLLQNLEMGYVHVRIHSEKALENGSDYVHNVWRKRLANSYRKYFLVVQSRLNPCHQVIDIFWCTTSDGLFNTHAIRPFVFILRSCGHNRAADWRACIHQHAVQQGYFVVEISHVHSQPIMQILTNRLTDRFKKITCPKSCGCIFMKVKAAASRRCLLLWLECLSSATSAPCQHRRVRSVK